MIQINTQDAKTKLSYLLAEVETKGERIKICRNGKPIAVLIPFVEVGDPLKQNSKLKKVVFYDDPSKPLMSIE
jgi:prevent-host-death family protein